MEQVGMLDWENCKLANDERKLFLGAEHPLAKKEHLTLGDLKTLRLAWISDSRDRISREYARYFDSSYRLGNKEDCLSLAIRNEAVFIQAHRLFSSDWRMRQHLLVARSIPIAELDSHTEIYAFHAPELSEAEQVFWDYLIQEFPRHLHQDNAV
jgi:DNA-binding transcriptional LysR family regulator